MRSRVRGLVAAAALVVLVVGGTGAGAGVGQRFKQPKGPASETIAVKGGNFFFDPDKIDATAGVARIELEGQGGLHTFVFDKGKYPGFQLEVSGSGDDDAKKIKLKTGKYTFYCDIPGHRAAGMVGTLTVKKAAAASSPSTSSAPR
jgi:uncharacterized cupredoxin-like copper-binding protein